MQASLDRSIQEIRDLESPALTRMELCLQESKEQYMEVCRVTEELHRKEKTEACKESMQKARDIMQRIKNETRLVDEMRQYVEKQKAALIQGLSSDSAQAKAD